MTKFHVSGNQPRHVMILLHGWLAALFVLSLLAVDAGIHATEVKLRVASVAINPPVSTGLVGYPEGNYEVESARVAERSGEIIVTSALRMLAELHQEAVSLAPTAPKQ